MSVIARHKYTNATVFSVRYGEVKVKSWAGGFPPSWANIWEAMTMQPWR
jgi:hypothetical protein